MWLCVGRGGEGVLECMLPFTIERSNCKFIRGNQKQTKTPELGCFYIKANPTNDKAQTDSGRNSPPYSLPQFRLPQLPTNIAELPSKIQFILLRSPSQHPNRTLPLCSRAELPCTADRPLSQQSNQFHRTHNSTSYSRCRSTKPNRTKTNQSPATRA